MVDRTTRVEVFENMGKNAKSEDTSKKTAKPLETAYEGEYLCTTCEHDGVRVEAINFCMECNSNLCPTCVGQHRKFPTMKGHKVLGKSARRHINRDVIEEENLLECENHPGKMVDMYCREHDDVWCGGCMTVHHRLVKVNGRIKEFLIQIN